MDIDKQLWKDITVEAAKLEMKKELIEAALKLYLESKGDK